MSDSTTPANTLAYFTVPLPPELLAELRAVAESCGRTPEEWASLALGGRLANIRTRKRINERLELEQWIDKAGGN
jgi:hypothetical protein